MIPANNRLTRLISLYLAFWMLFGSTVFWTGWVAVAFVACLAGACLWAGLAYRGGLRPVLLIPTLGIGLGMLVSLAGNLEISSRTAWILVYLFGVSALFLGARLGAERLAGVLYWAGWIWLVLWPLPRLWGWADNRNLLAVWPVVAVLVILSRGKPWWWALPHLFVLVLLGSRGAFLSLCLGLLAWFRPRLHFRQAAFFGLAGLAFIYALTIYRPKEALNRFFYWDQAIHAFVDHNLWVGLGPGGIFARQAILEPGRLPGSAEAYHLHAHNLLVQVLAETGLVGLLALFFTGFLILKMHIQGRWQIPILAAILTHCLVDFPLYFPGHLLVFMAVAGTVSANVPALDVLREVGFQVTRWVRLAPANRSLTQAGFEQSPTKRSE